MIALCIKLAIIIPALASCVAFFSERTPFPFCYLISSQSSILSSNSCHLR
jgi:hypothetical protein